MRKLMICAAFAACMFAFSSCQSEGEKAADQIIELVDNGQNSEAYQLYLQYCMTLSAEDIADMNTALTEEGCYYYEE